MFKKLPFLIFFLLFLFGAENVHAQASTYGAQVYTNAVNSASTQKAGEIRTSTDWPKNAFWPLGQTKVFQGVEGLHTITSVWYTPGKTIRYKGQPTTPDLIKEETINGVLVKTGVGGGPVLAIQEDKSGAPAYDKNDPGTPSTLSIVLDSLGETVDETTGGALSAAEKSLNAISSLTDFLKGGPTQWFISIAELLLTMGSNFMFFSGQLFGHMLDINTTQLVEYIGDGGKFGDGISNVWALLRDLSNIVFIFFVVFIAINIIIKGDITGQRRTLASVIVVALLLNFSLFLTRAVIDVSNIVTVAIFNQMNVSFEGGSELSGASKGNQLSASILGYSGITTIYKPDPTTGNVNIEGKADKAILIALYGFAFMGIMSLAFIIVSILLFVRVIAFVLLMIASPIAFISTIFPGKGKALFSKWLHTLTSQAFATPALLLMLYITLQLVAALNAANPSVGGSLAAGLSGDTPPDGSFWALIINLVVLIILLFISIAASQKVGFGAGQMSGAAIGGFKGVARFGGRRIGGATFGSAAFVGRRVGGAAGESIARGAARLEAKAGFGAIGSAGRKLGNKMATSDFDMRRGSGIQSLFGQAGEKTKGGYRAGKQQKEDRYKDTIKALKELSPAQRQKIAAQEKLKKDKTDANPDLEKALNLQDRVFAARAKVADNSGDRTRLAAIARPSAAEAAQLAVLNKQVANLRTIEDKLADLGVDNNEIQELRNIKQAIEDIEEPNTKNVKAFKKRLTKSAARQTLSERALGITPNKSSSLATYSTRMTTHMVTGALAGTAVGPVGSVVGAGLGAVVGATRTAGRQRARAAQLDAVNTADDRKKKGGSA